MKLFFEIVKLSTRRQITYRAATLAGLATNFFFGLMRAALMAALYGARPAVEGMTLADAITYTGLSQASIAYLSLFSWWEVMRSVYSGQVGSDLLKPMSFFNFWLAQDLGRALVSFIARGVTIMAFYAVAFEITYPHSLGQWLALFISMLLAWMVSFAWRFLLNLSAFWTPNASGILRLGFSISWFLSGFLMPIRFFPAWFQQVCYLTPFPHMVNTTIEIYLGLVDGPLLVQALLAQAFWVLLLILLGQLILSQGMRRLVIQGG
ncbi:MAG: ABC-2 family transporter protein [Anaerolineales bacterium]|nr:ABC-2 family transporter protein [Anaerolineales bacterium]